MAVYDGSLHERAATTRNDGSSRIGRRTNIRDSSPQTCGAKTQISATFALLSQADSALNAEQPKRAILLLERAVRIEPRNFELWIRLSRAHLATHNLVAAKQHARKAIALADANASSAIEGARAKAWLQYAEVLEYAGQESEAASLRQRYRKRRG